MNFDNLTPVPFWADHELSHATLRVLESLPWLDKNRPEIGNLTLSTSNLVIVRIIASLPSPFFNACYEAWVYCGDFGYYRVGDIDKFLVMKTETAAGLDRYFTFSAPASSPFPESKTIH